MQVDFLPIYDSLTDSEGQLKSAYTTDGLHLSVAGYQAFIRSLKRGSFLKKRLILHFF